MITGDLPVVLPDKTKSYGDYVADQVGAALTLINEFEASIPAVAEAIKAERSALIGSIVEA